MTDAKRHMRYREKVGGTLIGLVGLSMLLLSTGLHAQQDKSGTCRWWRAVAWQIMHARQSDVPMRDERRAMRDKPGQATVNSLIMKAYDEPVFAATKNKRKAEQEFSASVDSVCREQMDGAKTP